MLSCEDVKNLLSAYYDGELGVAAQQQVAEHMAACEACREEYEQLKALSGAFGALTFPESDKAFRAGLHERLETEAKKNRTVRFGTVWRDMRTYAAVAACLVLTVGIYAAVKNNSVQPYPQPAAPNPQMEAYENKAAVLPSGDILAPSEETASPETIPEQKIADSEGISASPKTTNPLQASPSPNPAQDGAASGQGQASAPTPTPAAELVAPTPQQTNMPHATSEPRTETPEVRQEPPPENTGAGADTPSGETDPHAGGNSSGVLAVNNSGQTTTKFTMTDKNIYDSVAELLGSFGTVTVTDTSIQVKVLSANYNACLAALRSVQGLQEADTIVVEGEESGHCIIQINIAK